MTPNTLLTENRNFAGTAGTSPNNRHYGFQSAFRDNATGLIYLSRFSDGRIAPIHILDGLPDKLVISRATSGQVLQVSDSIEAGFVWGEDFYTREQASRLV